jgi:hypothetical protein
MFDGQMPTIGLDAPVILLGRGGSGTRMISQLVQQLNVYLGDVANVSSDSLDWVETLYDLAIEVLGAGVVAGSARDSHWRDRLRRKAADMLAFGGRSPGEPWGWKLPETMLALAPVLRAFPEARVVHLVRHPVTSALRRTHLTSRMDNPIGRAVLRAAYRARGLEPDRIGRDEPYFHNAVSWDFQLRTATGILNATETPALMLRYEDVCADPHGAQARIAHYLGLPPPSTAQSSITDESRTNEAASVDPRAQRVWSICRETASGLGYEAAAPVGGSRYAVRGPTSPP